MTVAEPAHVTQKPAWHRNAVLTMRTGLVVLWLTWAVLAWWSAPRQATTGQLGNDITAGRISSYQIADGWQPVRLWAAPPQARENYNGGIFVWTVNNGQTYWTILAPANNVARTLAFDGILHRSGNSTLQQTAAVTGAILLLAGLIVLLGGPAPTYGTRWFWFWIGQIPLGVGFLAWLWLERPWVNRPPPPDRHTGWWGFGVLLLAGLAASVLGYATRNLTGSWLIPI